MRIKSVVLIDASIQEKLLPCQILEGSSEIVTLFSRALIGQ